MGLVVRNILVHHSGHNAKASICVPGNEDISKSKYLLRQRLMASNLGDSDKEVKE